MKLNFLIVACLIFLSGCRAIPNNLSDECKDFFAFFQDNWIKDEETLVYGFKDDAQYWLYSKYFKASCFKGIPKKSLIDLLGEPSKAFIFKDWELYTYCLKEDCLNDIKATGFELTFTIYNQHISNAYCNPAQTGGIKHE